jgi:hypothetical protein
MFLSSDVSDRYNNLKASWDSLMEVSLLPPGLLLPTLL